MDEFAGLTSDSCWAGWLLSGKDPSAFNPADPLRLWIIQVGKFRLWDILNGRVGEEVQDDGRHDQNAD